MVGITTAVDASDDLPVVIGSGLGGLATSRQLSRAGIAHHLIGGGPPAPRPRLGESLNGEGTVDVLHGFPDYRRFFHPKTGLVFHAGEYVTYCELDACRWKAILRLLRLLDFPAFEQLLHLDRAGFDCALYDEALASPLVHEIRDSIAAVEYDRESDLIEGLSLAGGRRLRPRFVLDATNHARLIPRAIGLPVRELGAPQYVVYTHYHRDHTVEAAAWLECTNLMVMDRQRDGLSGFAWCIPLGSYVSVGSSQDSEGAERDSEVVVEAVREAYRRRGIDITASFERQGETHQQPSRSFFHERATGRNWLLIGGTAAQIWFTSGSGVGLALAAANLAPRIVGGDRRAARFYDRLLREFESTHAHHESIRRFADNGMDLERLRKVTDALVQSTFLRLCVYSRGRRRRAANVLIGALEALLRRAVVVTDFCSGGSAPEHAQSAWVEDVHHGARERRTLEELFAIISGHAPLEAVDALLAPRVRMEMDGIAIGWGARCWKSWVWFLRRTAEERGPLRLECLHAVRQENEWVVKCRWVTRSADQTSCSREFELGYRFVDGRIAVIRTRKKNYEFIHGRRIGNWVAFAALVGSITRARLQSGSRLAAG